MELDDSCRAICDELRAQAPALRACALDVDANPEHITAYADTEAFRTVHRLSMPGAQQLRQHIQRYPRRRCLEFAAGLFEAARGDAGATLACPGPSVAGAVIDLLADDDQRARFYDAVGDGRTWAFCAITEPQAGSDAMRMATRLDPDGSGGYLLTGVKRFIGNAACGRIGVVFARTGPSPLAIRAALVEVPAKGLNGLTATPLDMLGLRGARIGQLQLDAVPVAATDLLGNHLSAGQRGMWGAIRAFDKVRLQVGAMALGTAAAVCDYVRSERRELSTWDSSVVDTAMGRIRATRDLLHRAAADVDADRGRGHLASLAKLESVALARQVTTEIPRLLGRGALLEHPLLEKWRRDAQGFEFMEGTSAIQRLNIAEGYLRRTAAKAATTNAPLVGAAR